MYKYKINIVHVSCDIDYMEDRILLYINFSMHIPIVSDSLYPILHVEDQDRDY